MSSNNNFIQNSHQTLVVIDSQVENYETLLQGIDPNAEVVVLDPNQDGIHQITSLLSNFKNIDSLQIIAHGSSGSIQLGNTILDNQTLNQYTRQFQQWQTQLTADADILLYGCNVASGSLGQSFVTNLSQLTQTDVAASENLTGASYLGADWNLEYATGTIDTSLAIQTQTLSNYDGVLLNTLVDESFKDIDLNTTTLNWLYGNGEASPNLSTSNLPFLTARADRNPQPGGIPGVPTGTDPALIDSDGNGALRLTSVKNASGTSLTNQQGFIIYNNTIDSDKGLTILFDYYSYGGQFASGTPIVPYRADGLSFFLIDGSKSPTKAGAFGGSLGYAQNRNLNPDGTSAGTPTNGIEGGYIGIGFDEYGNFATQVNNSNRTVRVGSSNPDLKTPVRDSITIRGKEILLPGGTQDLSNSYDFIATYDALPNGVNGIDAPNDLYFDVNNNPVTVTRDTVGVKRKVGIQLSKDGILSLFFDTNSNGIGDAGEYVFDDLDLKAANGDTSLPSTFKFGFAAATGGATNIHEISNLKVLTLGSPPVVDLDYDDITVPAGYDYNTTFTEGDSPILIASSNNIVPTVSDPDGDDIISLTLAISNILDGVEEVLTIGGTQFPLNVTQTATVTVGTTSFTVKYDDTTKQVTITKPDNSNILTADLQTLLQSITYENTSQNPTVGARTISVIANDGVNVSNTAVSTITVAPFPDPPIIDLDGSTPGNNYSTTFTENSTGIAIADTDI
ncbi:DUF4347 domain-containing protein, partial [Planktothrix mougeotii]